METTGQGQLLPSLGEGFKVKISKCTLLELLSIILPQSTQIQQNSNNKHLYAGIKPLTFSVNNHCYSSTACWRELLRKPAKHLWIFLLEFKLHKAALSGEKCFNRVPIHTDVTQLSELFTATAKKKRNQNPFLLLTKVNLPNFPECFYRCIRIP